MNKQAEEQNVFAVVNDVFEIVSKPFYGDRQIAEVRLKEAAKVINSYCTAHAQAEKERAVLLEGRILELKESIQIMRSRLAELDKEMEVSE